VGLRGRAPQRAWPRGGRVLRRPALTAWARLAALALVVAALFVLVATRGGLSAERVRGWADGWGVAGPLVFIAISATLTVALFPGPLLAGASGLLFGTALGTPVSIVSATLGATLAFTIARHMGRDAAEQIAHGRVRRAREWIGGRGFLSVLYARLAPGLPYSLVNYAAGLAPIRARDFVLATAIGCAPRAFAYTALGGSLHDLSKPEALVAIGILVVMALAAPVIALRRSGPGRATSSPDARSAGPR
jgi:uncharacterized membrane protein YdjX (TVP38/TMEM64 family)